MRAREPLPLAVAQPLCAAYDVEANVATHARLIRSADARVVVFPELSLTGYHMDAPALRVEDALLAPVVEACAVTGSVALVGAPVHAQAGGAHIAMLAVDGNGVRLAYRKVWLSDEESEWFKPGTDSGLLEVDGWRLGLAICKDTSIVQHASDTAALGIDAYVAGTLMFEEERTLQDERARRIASTHKVWVAFASFAGPTGSGYSHTAARSGIWAPRGALVAQAGAEPGAIARAQLTLAGRSADPLTTKR